MDETLLMLVVAGLALALGAALGWLAWGRTVSLLRGERDAAQAVAADLRDGLVAAQRDHALAAKDAEERTRDAGGLRDEIVRLLARIDLLDADRLALAELRSTLAERDANHLTRARELEEKFAQLAAAALDKSHASFVERAEETLKRHREAASASLVENKAALDLLIQPMRETLAKYETQLKEIEEKRASAYGAITSAIADVRAGQDRVSGEAARLVHALRHAPKARGRWGEHQLRRVLEMAGLSRHVDFAEEVTVGAEDGRQRPDAVISLPGERVLVIDAKCSLVAYQDALDAPDEEARRVHLLAHARALRSHADALGRKSYADQFAGTLDFVIMFVPGENFLAAALEVDHDLFETAFARRVLLASPTNLIAIARTVAMVWQQEKATDDARRIAALGKELYDRIATMSGHVARLGKNLGAAAIAYNEFVASLDRNVLTSAQRFRELAIDAPSGKIEAPNAIGADVRVSAKLPPPAEAAE
jgi:DNA recombination protein RmuC